MEPRISDSMRAVPWVVWIYESRGYWIAHAIWSLYLRVRASSGNIQICESPVRKSCGCITPHPSPASPQWSECRRGLVRCGRLVLVKRRGGMDDSRSSNKVRQRTVDEPALILRDGVGDDEEAGGGRPMWWLMTGKAVLGHDNLWVEQTSKLHDMIWATPILLGVAKHELVFKCWWMQISVLIYLFL